MPRWCCAGTASRKRRGRRIVILDTDPSDNAFAGFDACDDRSLIENICNREVKESWFLEHHPKRSEAGVRVHAWLVFTCSPASRAAPHDVRHIRGSPPAGKTDETARPQDGTERHGCDARP